MNKIIRVIISLIIMTVTMGINGGVVYAAGATLEGPTSARGGDTIKISVVVSDSGQYGLEGTFSYDANQVSLVSVTSAKNGWKVEQNGKTIVAYDDTLTKPTSGKSKIVTAVFKIKEGVNAKDVVKISVDGLVCSDGNNEKNYGKVQCSVTILPQLSGDNKLLGLSVSNGNSLSPAFNSSVLNYNIGEVEYADSTLKIDYVLSDEKSKVSILNNNLVVGKNTVKVNVKAENGNIKTYTITVTRKQDPNYVPSSNCKLDSINVSGGNLSPVFEADIKEYIVYVPYENKGKTFEVTAKAQDSKVKYISVGKIEKLNEGENQIKIVCSAEDGTTAEYKVVVYVMPKYNGQTPYIGENVVEQVPVVTPEPENDNVVTPEPEINKDEDVDVPGEEITESETVKNEEQNETQKTTDGKDIVFPWWGIIIVLLLGAVIGMVVTIIVIKKEK